MSKNTKHLSSPKKAQSNSESDTDETQSAALSSDATEYGLHTLIFVSGSEQDRGCTEDETPGNVNRYQVIEEIAHGGFGIVYKARHLHLSRLVALKMLRPERLFDSGEQSRNALVERFFKEARIASSIRHPNVVEVLDFGISDQLPFYTMPLLKGQSLAKLLAETKLDPHRAARIAMDIASGAQAIHDKNLVHRDLSPANVLIDEDGCVRITDFGLAKSIEFDSSITGENHLLGTLDYMSPEQSRDPRGVDCRADVYSIGAILYHLLCGIPPFKGTSPHDTVSKINTSDPLPVRNINQEVPQELAALCEHCLEKVPDNRYQSARELAEDLQRFLCGFPTRVRPVGILVRTAKLAKRNKLVASLISATVVLTIVSAIFLTADWLKVRNLNFQLASSNDKLAISLTNERESNAAIQSNLEASGKLIRSFTQTVMEQVDDLAGRQKLKADLTRCLTEFSSHLVDANALSDETVVEVANTYQMAGSALYDLGSRDESEKAFREAVNLFSHVDSSEAKKAAFESNVQIARIQWVTKRLDDAIEILDKLNLLLPEMPADENWKAKQRMLVENQLALCLARKGQVEEGLAMMLLNIASLESLDIEMTFNDFVLVGTLHNDCGYLCIQSAKWNEARKCLSAAVANYRQAITHFPDSVRLKSFLAGTLLNLGTVAENNEASIQFRRESVEILSKLAIENPNSASVVLLAVDAAGNLISKLVELGQIQEANQLFEQNIALAMDLPNRLPTHPRTYRTFAEFVQKRLLMLVDSEKMDDADKLSIQICEAWDKAVSLQPENQELLMGQAQSLRDRAKVLIKSTQWGKAVSTLELAKEIGNQVRIPRFDPDRIEIEEMLKQAHSENSLQIVD